MAKIDYTPDARVLVGIDISKHRHEVLIAAPGKTRRRCMTITNSTDDFMRLIAMLREYGLPVRIGFEATGNYHRVLMYHLGVAGGLAVGLGGAAVGPSTDSSVVDNQTKAYIAGAARVNATEDVTVRARAAERVLSVTIGLAGGGPALKVGIAFDFQVVDAVPREDWDVGMDIVVTEKRILRARAC